MSSGPRPPHRPADLLTSVMSRPLKLGPRRNTITVERGIGVPMRDGTILQTDHYAPVSRKPRATVLMRCPYGRGWQFAIMARPFAERGYHVLLQSCRGTFGSGGEFTPGRHEAADGQDTVAWLRRQPWFNGRLATVGPSYLAFTAWALAADPPPELTAMAVYISTHDLAAAGFGHGPFELYNLLFWTDLMANQELLSAPRMMWRTMNAGKRLAGAMDRLPLAATGASIDGKGAPWYTEWLAHQDPDDAYWDGYRATAALDRVTVPTLLITGFHDFFVEQTLQEYQALRQRGVTTGLTIGPWTHLELDMGLAIRETVAWLDAFAAGNGAAPSPRRHAVRVWTSGVDRWQELPDWPPAGAQPAAFSLMAGGRLAAGEAGTTGASTLRYDPAEPTPSVGGRLMSVRHGGSHDNTALEARADVLTFTSAPLERPVEIAGAPVVRLYLSSDNVYYDVFARLCDVDVRGKSRNLADQIMRSSPEQLTPGETSEVEMTLTDVSHVFLAGHRIRLQVSGGAHPRFSRNLGVEPDLMNGTHTASVTHQIGHSEQYPSALILPVLGTAPEPAAAQTARRDLRRAP